MTFNTATVLKHGPTNQNMKATTLLEENMALEATNGMTDPCTLVTGGRTRYPASVSTHGLTVDATKVSGSTTTWRAWGSTSGTTEECTKVSIKTIRNMDSAFTPGLTGEAMKDIGTKANSTASVPT